MALKQNVVYTRFNVEKQIDLGNENALISLGINTTAQAKALMVPDTGLLRNSIMYKTNTKDGGFNDSSGVASDSSEELQGDAPKDELYVGSNVEYAPYEEFGTRYRAPKPFLRPAVDIEVRGSDGVKAVAKAMNASLKKIDDIKSRKKL